MNHTTNLKITLNEKEYNTICEGKGVLTKTHNEDGRNYQIKICALKPPVANDGVMTIAIRELQADAV